MAHEQFIWGGAGSKKILHADLFYIPLGPPSPQLLLSTCVCSVLDSLKKVLRLFVNLKVYFVKITKYYMHYKHKELYETMK